MNKAKVLLPLILAAASSSALAATGGTDVFGRPDSGWNGLDAAYSAEPFDPLPQFGARNDVVFSASTQAAAPEVAAEAGAKTDVFGRPYVNATALDTYAQSAPFDPLPQLWQSRLDAPNPAVASGASDAKVKG